MMCALHLLVVLRLLQWGVRFPLAVKTSVHGSNTAGGGSKERVCYGPVLPFYLGKAGEETLLKRAVSRGLEHRC